MQKRFHESVLIASLLAPAFLFTMGCSSAQSLTVRDVVVEPAQFSTATENTIVLDARDALMYAAGHVHGAVRIDPRAWMQASLATDGGIENTRIWSDRIGELGIDESTIVRIYDDGNMKDAARIWFILQHFGVRNSSVVNGGWPALNDEAAKGRIRASNTATMPTRRPFTARISNDAPVGLKDRESVRESVARGSAQVLDARTIEEYRGQIIHKNPRGGHLPGAKSLPHADLLDAGGRLRSASELAAIFEKSGFKKGEPIITHCESGGRASLAALAAVRAGYGPVSNYYRSFTDWSRDAACPVVKE
ncbi:MAG: sulfurtransferase [Planctomycetes bacterium]|nr:sulfurtransferase [Planctomycetota bacterium]